MSQDNCSIISLSLTFSLFLFILSLSTYTPTDTSKHTLTLAHSFSLSISLFLFLSLSFTHTHIDTQTLKLSTPAIYHTAFCFLSTGLLPLSIVILIIIFVHAFLQVHCLMLTRMLLSGMITSHVHSAIQLLHST